MFSALCQGAHPLKHSLAESIFVSRVQKNSERNLRQPKISLARSLVSRGITVIHFSKYLLTFRGNIASTCHKTNTKTELYKHTKTKHGINKTKTVWQRKEQYKRNQSTRKLQSLLCVSHSLGSDLCPLSIYIYTEHMCMIRAGQTASFVVVTDLTLLAHKHTVVIYSIILRIRTLCIRIGFAFWVNLWRNVKN